MPLRPDILKRCGYRVPKPLTKRQLRIAKLQMIGKSVKEMSYLLGVTEHTISAHIFEIHRRLGVENVAGLIWRMTELKESPYVFDREQALEILEAEIMKGAV